MDWLFPGFLVGAVAVALPIVLHRLRKRPMAYVPFPSLRFLAKTPPRDARANRWRRFLVMLMRVAALALLAAAFARPYFGEQRLGGTRAVVLVVDDSFSLQADGRAETLRAWAREQVGELRGGDKLGVLRSGTRPEWWLPLQATTDVALLKLERVGAGWESTRLEPALRLAAATLAAVPVDQREIVVVSDQQRVSWAVAEFGKKLPAGVSAVFALVAAELKRQAALVAPTMERTPEGVRARLPVRNFTGEQRRTLRVYREGGLMPVHEETLGLREGERRTVEIALTLPAGDEQTWFRFELDADELPADDRVYATARRQTGVVVRLDALPAGAADYVGTALAASKEVEPALEVGRLAGQAAWSEQAVMVLRSGASFAGGGAARLAEFLRGGGSALVFVDGTRAQREWLAQHGVTLTPVKAGDAGTLTLRDWAMDHPLIAGMAGHSVTALLDWNFQRGWALPVERVEPLALWPEGGAAIGEVTVGAGRLLVCGFPADRRDGEWAVETTFVPFVHRAVVHLSGAREMVGAKPWRVGERVGLPVEAGQWLALDGPGMGAPVREVRGSVTPDRPGVYSFSQDGARRLFAVNVSEDESDPAGWRDGTPWNGMVSRALAAREPGPRVTAAAVDAEGRGQLWWWALAIMAALVLAEVGLANRTAR